LIVWFLLVIHCTTNKYDFVGKVKESKTPHTDYRVTWINVVSPAVVTNLNNTLSKVGGKDGWIAGMPAISDKALLVVI
jgi:hypothetical protein